MVTSGARRSRTSWSAPSMSLQISGTITVCTNSDPAIAATSTARSACVVRLPIENPLVDFQLQSIERQ